MIRKSLLAPSLLLAACSGEAVPGRAALAESVASSIFQLAAAQAYALPPVPDDLLLVSDVADPQQTFSLTDGTVIGAWTTAPTAAGLPPALIWRCQPDANGDYRWVIAPDAGLVPLGIDPGALAAALPFSAAHTAIAPAGIYLYAPSGPAWTVTGQMGAGAAAATLRTQLIGAEDALDEGPDPASAPWCRYRKTSGWASGLVGVPTLDRADYVLRLDTQGGLGPDDEGAICDPGSLDVRSEMDADFYFLTVPWADRVPVTGLLDPAS